MNGALMSRALTDLVHRLRGLPRWLWLLLLFCGVRGLLWAILVPPFQSPDEQMHFSGVYDFYINKSSMWSIERGYDNRTAAFTALTQFGGQRFRPLDRRRFTYEDTMGPREEQIAKLPDRMAVRDPRNPILEHGPFYYWFASFVLRLLPTTHPLAQMLAIRLVSVVLGILAVFFAYLAAREFFPEEEFWQASVTVFFAFIPMMTFLTSTVNADAYAIPIVSITFWALLRWLREHDRKSSVMWLSVALILVVSTKKNMYFLIPYVVFVAFCHMIVRRRIYWRDIFFLSIPVLVLAVFYLTYPGFKAFTFEYETEAHGIAVVPMAWSDIDYGDVVKHLLWINLPGYWGKFGWGHARFPEGIDQVLRFVTHVSLLLCLALVLLPVRTRFPKSRLFVLLGYILFLMTSIVTVNLHYLNSMGRMYVLGRYLLSAWFPHSVCIVFGFTGFLRDSSARRVGIFICSLLVLANVYALFFVILPRYCL